MEKLLTKSMEEFQPEYTFHICRNFFSELEDSLSKDLASDGVYTSVIEDEILILLG